MRYPDTEPTEPGWYRVNIADRKTGMDRLKTKAFWTGAKWLFSSKEYNDRTYEVKFYEPEKIGESKKRPENMLPNNKPVEKYCPECKPLVKLLVKTNRNNGNQFLGCPNWPNCSYTSEIPEDVRLRALGQKGMFDED